MDADIDHLFALPLKEFIAERNDLARRLKLAGDFEGAEAVRSLSKPSLSAWVVNQLVRHRRNEVLALLQAVDALREAQASDLTGAEASEALMEAAGREREALARVGAAVPTLLTEHDHVASPAIVDRAMRSLRAAAANPESREILERGQLVGDLIDQGFSDVFPGVQAPPPPPRKKPPRDTIDLEIETTRREAAAKREEAEERRRNEADRVAREDRARTLQKKLDVTRRALAAAQETEARLEHEAHTAERERAEAERRLRDAERLRDQVSTRLDEARAVRAEAESQLAALRAESRELG